MSWIVYSGGMFASSIFMYLLIRKAKNLKVSSRLITYSYGAFPLLLVFTFAIVSKLNVELTVKQVTLLGVIGILLSYLGNKFSIKGIESAPNPGYSLIIQKSYAPLSAFLAFFLLGSELKAISILSFIVVIASISQVAVDPGMNVKKDSGTWVFYSIFPFFAYSFLAVGSKYLIGTGLHPIIVSGYIFLFAGIGFTIDFREKLILDYHEVLRVRRYDHILLLILIAIANSSFNIFMFEAFAKAPNIGYVNIINASSITVITLASALVFKDKLNLQKILGIISATAGLMILFV